MAFLQQVFTAPSMVSGNSVTSTLELPGCFLYVYLGMPTMTTGFGADTATFIKVSHDGVTFQRFSNPENNTSVVGTNDFKIVSAASQKWVLVPNFAFRYVQVETTAAATANVVNMNPFRFLCVSNQ